jgi:hypothetical protein
MLAGFAGVNCLDSVPMIWGGDQHSVDIFAFENVAVITTSNARAGVGDSGFEPVLIHVTHGCDPDYVFF